MESKQFQNQYPYLISTMENNEYQKVDIITINPIDLVIPYRIDLMAKLLLLDEINHVSDSQKAFQIYETHLLSFGGGIIRELGNANKNSLDIFISVFLSIFRDMEALPKQSIVCMKQPIPIDNHNMLLDGAHRATCALFFNHTIFAYFLPSYQSHNRYDYYFFRTRFLSESNLLEMIIKYISLKQTALYVLHIGNRFKISRLIYEYRLRNILDPVFTYIDKNNIYLLTDTVVTSSEKVHNVISNISFLSITSILLNQIDIQNHFQKHLAITKIRDKKRVKYYPLKLLLLRIYFIVLNSIKKILHRPILLKRKQK